MTVGVAYVTCAGCGREFGPLYLSDDSFTITFDSSGRCVWHGREPLRAAFDTPEGRTPVADENKAAGEDRGSVFARMSRVDPSLGSVPISPDREALREATLSAAKDAAREMAFDWTCSSNPHRYRRECPECVAEVVADALLAGPLAGVLEAERDALRAENERLREAANRAALALDHDDWCALVEGCWPVQVFVPGDTPASSCTCRHAEALAAFRTALDTPEGGPMCHPISDHTRQWAETATREELLQRIESQNAEIERQRQVIERQQMRADLMASTASKYAKALRRLGVTVPGDTTEGENTDG